MSASWREVPLGDLVENLDRQRVPVSASERAKRAGSVPYYGAAGQVGTIDAPLFNEELVLLGEDGVQFFDPHKSKAYCISGPSWVNNHAHVLRPHRDRVDHRFLLHFLNHFDYAGFANGTTRLKLTQAAMNRIPVTLPPLDEQRRIVAILEDHLSRLEVATASLVGARQRVDTLDNRKAAEVFESFVERRRLDEVAEVRLGRQRSPSNHAGPTMRPYLRAANVTWDGLALDDVKEMQFTDQEMSVYALRAGDLLLSEASGSASEVGKPALWTGELPECAFQNTLIRVRPLSVEAQFLLHFFTYVARSGGFSKSSRGVGIHHLGRAALAGWMVPAPSLVLQERAITTLSALSESTARLSSQVATSQARASSLRRSLLQAAFSGQLTKESSVV